MKVARRRECVTVAIAKSGGLGSGGECDNRATWLWVTWLVATLLNVSNPTNLLCRTNKKESEGGVSKLQVSCCGKMTEDTVVVCDECYKRLREIAECLLKKDKAIVLGAKMIQCFLNDMHADWRTNKDETAKHYAEAFEGMPEQMMQAVESKPND